MLRSINKYSDLKPPYFQYQIWLWKSQNIQEAKSGLGEWDEAEWFDILPKKVNKNVILRKLSSWCITADWVNFWRESIHACATMFPLFGCQLSSSLCKVYLRYSKYLDSFWFAHVENFFLFLSSFTLYIKVFLANLNLNLVIFFFFFDKFDFICLTNFPLWFLSYYFGVLSFSFLYVICYAWFHDLTWDRLLNLLQLSFVSMQQVSALLSNNLEDKFIPPLLPYFFFYHCIFLYLI